MYIWKECKGFLLNIILIKGFRKALRGGGSYIDVKGRGFVE